MSGNNPFESYSRYFFPDVMKQQGTNYDDLEDKLCDPLKEDLALFKENLKGLEKQVLEKKVLDTKDFDFLYQLRKDVILQKEIFAQEGPEYIEKKINEYIKNNNQGRPVDRTCVDRIKQEYNECLNKLLEILNKKILINERFNFFNTSGPEWRDAEAVAAQAQAQNKNEAVNDEFERYEPNKPKRRSEYGDVIVSGGTKRKSLIKSTKRKSRRKSKKKSKKVFSIKRKPIIKGTRNIRNKRLIVKKTKCKNKRKCKIMNR